MPTNMPDMDMLALAGMTKASLRDIDSTSVGGSPHADKINIRAMAGIDGPLGPAHATRGPATPRLLNSFDFIEEPKSRPMGRVSMDGETLPNRPIDFAHVPEAMQDNMEHMLAHVSGGDGNGQPSTPPVQQPTISSTVPQLTPDMDFDLFQFTILKEIVDKLDISITSVETCLDDLKSRRDHINNLIAGGENGK